MGFSYILPFLKGRTEDGFLKEVRMKKQQILLGLLLTTFLFSCSPAISRKIAEGDEDVTVTDNETDDHDTIVDGDTPLPDETVDDDGGGDDSSRPDIDETPDENPDYDTEPLPVEPRAGFIEIESVSYSLDGDDMHSDQARMWYSFHPAESEPENKPIFVFFNGGPGSATALLFSYNTTEYTADQTIAAPDVIVENPTSFTKMGSTIHIDARQTGFSYGMTTDPSSYMQRSSYYRTDNFNSYIDAADFIRVIFRVLRAMPDLENNQIVLVGESYGGIRATAILNLLLYYQSEKYSGGYIYKDTTLFSEINDHFRRIFPEISAEFSPEKIAEQFSHQVLIQPLLTGFAQMHLSGSMMEDSPTSAVAWIENETGTTYPGCPPSGDCYPHSEVLDYIRNSGYDVYAYKRPAEWLFDHSDVGIAALSDGAILSTMLGVTHTDIPYFSAAERADTAFRFIAEEGVLLPLSSQLIEALPQSVEFELRYREEYRELHPLAFNDLATTLGDLPNWDAYFIDLNRQITQIFYQVKASPYDNRFGDRFLENLSFVKTFITNAEEDAIIYAPAIPEVLKQYTQVIDVAIHANDFTIEYDDELLGRITRTVTFPYYGSSCHSVPVTEPVKFHNDVKLFRSW